MDKREARLTDDTLPPGTLQPPVLALPRKRRKGRTAKTVRPLQRIIPGLLFIPLLLH